MTIPFYKMSGSGNDFIIIDNRDNIVPMDDLSVFAARVCRRKLSVGADGLILIEPSRSVDFKWSFFNSDGSVAEMCGNGARCTARFALLNDIASKEMAFETIAGVIRAQVLNDRVKINMTDPHGLEMGCRVQVDPAVYDYDRINTGVPHVVIEVDDIEAADVVGIGRQIRRHADFSPAGTNVNFIGQDGQQWVVRTYERGVEDETLACGTGIVAGALVLAARKSLPSPISLRSRSGSLLNVFYSQTEDGFKEIFLEGDARIIYRGELTDDAWQYD
jgi:diaminopimelate epimerase